MGREQLNAQSQVFYDVLTETNERLLRIDDLCGKVDALDKLFEKQVRHDIALAVAKKICPTSVYNENGGVGRDEFIQEQMLTFSEYYEVALEKINECLLPQESRYANINNL